MTTPSAFGLLLCEKRKLANLTQGQLAQAINKTSLYIYNIEKGKNNAPPKQDDLDKLCAALELDDDDKQSFLEAAAADRGRLPQKQIDYISAHTGLAELIRAGTEMNISNDRWMELLEEIRKDKGAEQK